MKKINNKISIILFALQSYGVQAAPTDQAVSEGFKNPIGFYDATPSFSWKLPRETKYQQGYRVVVASDPGLLPDKADLWDSGKVDSDQSTFVPYAGKELWSRKKVYWQVMTWPEGKWSEVAHFELGLLKNEDWKGQWIHMDPSDGSAPEIVIHQATYGARNHPAGQKDVTAAVQKLVAEEKYHVVAGNELAGGDPAKGVPKVLMLEYSLNGKRKNITVEENKDLSLIAEPSNATYTPEYLRRDFDLPDKAIEKARLYLTAKGLFDVYLNGQKVGHDAFVPGYTSYEKRIETLCYDVTNLLRLRAENTIGAILAEGWYAGDLLAKKPFARYPQRRPKLLVQLEIIHKDGSTSRIFSDEHWKASDQGPIRYSSIYHGEVYDASMEMPGWNEPGFDAASWSPVLTEPVQPLPVLLPKRHHPVRVTQRLAAVDVKKTSNNACIFDLGQNFVGWAHLKIPVEAGSQIRVRFAEMLNQDGSLYTKNYRGARSTDTYTPAKTGTIAWNPTFTFHGFRYVELSGMPEGVQPKLDWVVGEVLHSNFLQSGRFTSSHAKLNQLQSNIRWGQLGNFLDIPTDCPQRNERLGWTGDAQVFCPTSLFNYDVHAFWMAWLQSCRDDQTEEGLVPNTVPFPYCGLNSPGWGDVAVVSPWDVYVRTGDLNVLAENYDMMRKKTAVYQREAGDTFIIATRQGFGDWLQPYPISKAGDGSIGDTPKDYIASAYFGRCAWTMAQVEKALGKIDDFEKYSLLFKNIRSAFSRKFFDGNGKLTTEHETQTAYLMALGFDLLEEPQRASATQNLLRMIDEADGHLRTGFLGTPLIAAVLDEVGHTDLAYSILFKETYPGWFYSINQGATTMWERWNSYSHTDGFGDDRMNSFNHYAYGAIGQWMYERIAGLAPDPENPGYKHFFIRPQPGGALTHARAELETPYGKAASGWIIEGDVLRVNAIVPPNTSATVFLPGENSTRHVGPGKHEFEVKL
jgi:alpha-L-rhamnosidase